MTSYFDTNLLPPKVKLIGLSPSLLTAAMNFPPGLAELTRHIRSIAQKRMEMNGTFMDCPHN